MRQSARHTAVEALLQVEENAGYSNIVIDKVLRSYEWDIRDKRLAAAIFYGTLEKQLTLDYYLSFGLKTPGKKLEPLAQVILRSAAYQIFYMDKIPDSAAVNEAVNLTRDFRRPALAGFVNAVLRSVLRQKASLTLPGGETIRELSIRYSVPEALIALWRQSYGKETALRLLSSFAEKSRTYIRINNCKATVNEILESFKKDSIQFKKTILPQAFAVDGEGSISDWPAFRQGGFHVQDLSSQLACGLVDPKPGDRVLDCCAAPGGKSFTMAEMMENRGELLAFDLYKGRVRLIQNGAERLGLSVIKAARHDAPEPWTYGAEFNRVLCDVPCSGYGVIAKKPEIRYKPVQSAAQLPEIQYRILVNAAGLVKPGGRLVYSTCTLNPAENGEVAGRFLAENPGFKSAELTLPPGIERIVPEPRHMLTMLPFAGASDGFFTAVFEKI